MEQPNNQRQDSGTACLDVKPKPIASLPPPTTIMCSSCEEEQAVVMCEDCQLYLCEDEFRAHKRAGKTRHHSLVSLCPPQPNQSTSSSSHHGSQSFKCSSHKGVELELFCQTCEKLVCLRCAYDEHPRPQPNTLLIGKDKQTIEGFKTEMKQIVNQIKANQSKLNQSLARIVEMEGKVKVRAQAATNQVNQTFTHLRECLQARQNQLLNQIEEVKTAKLNILAIQKQNVEAMVSRVNSTCGDGEKSVECEDERQFLVLRTTIKNEWKEMHDQIEPDQQPKEDDCIDCNLAERNDLEKRIGTFGSVNADLVCVENCVVEGVKNQLVGEPLEWKLVVKDNQMKTKNRGGDRIEVEGLSNVVVKDQGDGSYTLVGQFDHPGQYLVKLWINGKLKDQFLIEYQNRPARAWFIDRDPQVKFCFGSPGSGQGQFFRPRVAVDKQANIVVADSENHRIQVFDGRGNFLRMWGSEGTGQAQFKDPCGVAVDGQ